ncbi:MAG TPA: toprim domain-containing protein [Sphingobium sp.]
MIRNGRGGRYLDARGLAARPDALRYHPRTPVRVGGVLQFRPAIIAAVKERAELVAIQRNFLDPRKAALARDLPNPRLTLGRPLSGAVKLQPAQDVLGLAEGVETAMSASLLLGLPVWAVLGAERLHQVLIPAHVRRLILLPDNDISGWRSVGRAMTSYRRDALSVELFWPWGGLNDWSHVLAREMREGRGERDWARQAA